MPASKDRTYAVPQLLGVAALMATGYLLTHALCFTNDALNFAFVCLLFLIPFLAIRPVLRLRRWPKVAASIFLVPLLTVSLICLLITVTCDGSALVMHRELRRELATVEAERYSVHLLWEETTGGAVGPHGVGLEQRMFILPGLYLVKYVDYFEGAHEGSLALEGGNRVRVHIPKSAMNAEVNRVYPLKPRVYF